MKPKISSLNYPIAYAVLIAGVVMSALSFISISDFEMDKIRDDFFTLTSDRTILFERAVNDDLDILQSVAGFYYASRSVNRDEFRVFTNYIFSWQKDIMAISWLPRVLDTERQSFEEAVRNEGFADFRIKEIDQENRISDGSKRREYFPIYYVEPFEENKITFGLDAASESARRVAIERSKAEGKPIATAWIKLLRENSQDPGCRIFAPVYDNYIAEGAVGQSDENLRGFASIFFDIGKTAEVSWKGLQPRGIDIYMYDKSDPDGKRSIYFHNLKKQSFVKDLNFVKPKDGLLWSKVLDFAGREWEMIYTPSPEFYDVHTARFARPWAVLILGISLSVILFVYILELLSRTAKIERDVISRTSELSEINRSLEAEIISRKKAEDVLHDTYMQLKKTQKDLVQSEKEAALGRFSVGISHEVKNPLSVILGGAEYLEAKLADSDDDTKHNIAIIKKSALSANMILESILRYVRPSALNMDNTNLNDLVSEIVPLFKLQPFIVKLRIVVELSSENIILNVDRNQIHQVIFNVVKNAMEASSEGGRVIIRTGAADGFGIISVIDNGSGMSKEVLSNIFEPFFTTKRPGKGAGLGLLVARNIIDNHKGKLVIESEEGKGTIVKISLPLA